MDKEKEEAVVRLVVVIPKDLHRKLKTYAAQNDMAIRTIVIEQLRALLERE